jgi:hypothetical protein
MHPVTISWRTGLVVATLVATPSIAFAQDAAQCRFICEVAWKVEPTITIENLVNRHRVVAPDGIVERLNRERVFEVVLAVDMTTRIPWLGLTAEAITSPFNDDNVVELEFESNFYWLTESMTRGWVTSQGRTIACTASGASGTTTSSTCGGPPAQTAGVEPPTTS